MSGGSSGGGTNTVSSASQPPANFEAALSSLLSQGQSTFQTPLNQYPTGGAGSPNYVAPFNPTQQQSFGEVGNLQGIQTPYLNTASSDFNAAQSPLWSGIGGNITPAQIQQYESPYTANVLQTTEAAEANTDAQQQQQVEGNAIGAGAWGGDRSGIAAAITAGQQAIANNATNAGIENQGFTQAEGEANTEQQAQLGANEANAWLNSQAGFGQANLGNEALTTGLTGASALAGVGGTEQAQTQQQTNIPLELFQQQQAYPLQMLEAAAGYTSGLSGAAGGTGSSSGSYNPSALSTIAGAGETGIGLAGATGGFGSNGWLSSLFSGGGGSALADSGLLDTGLLTASSEIDPFLATAAMTIRRGGGVPTRRGGGGIAAVNDNRFPMRANGGIAGYYGGGNVTPPPRLHYEEGSYTQIPQYGQIRSSPGNAVSANTGSHGPTAPGTGDFGNPGQTFGQGLGQVADIGSKMGSMGIAQAIASFFGPNAGNFGPGTTFGGGSGVAGTGNHGQAGNSTTGADAGWKRGGAIARDDGGATPSSDPSSAVTANVTNDLISAGLLGASAWKRGGGVLKRDDAGGIPMPPAVQQDYEDDSDEPLAVPGRSPRMAQPGIADAGMTDLNNPEYGPPAGIAVAPAGHRYHSDYQAPTPANRAADIRSTAPWLALTEAGLATLGGTGSGISNIGKGGAEGLKTYLGLENQANTAEHQQEEAADTGKYRMATLDEEAERLSNSADDARARIAEQDKAQSETARHNTAQESDRAKQIGIEQTNADKGDWMPVRALTNPDGTPKVDANGVPQMLYRDTRTNNTKTGPAQDPTLSGRGGSGGGVTMQLANELIASGAAADLPTALKMIRDPGGKGAATLDAAKDRLAQTAAKADPDYDNDPIGTLKRYRAFYGVGNGASPTAAPAAGGNAGTDYSHLWGPQRGAPVSGATQ